MPGLPPARLVGLALGCYPRQWRQRHGVEAAELAALLIRDGVPARSIACSYLGGAARARVTGQPGRWLAATAAAVLVAAGSLGVPLGLLSAPVPASAASAAHQHAARPGPHPRCGLPSRTGSPDLLVLSQPRPAVLWAGPANVNRAGDRGQHC